MSKCVFACASLLSAKFIFLGWARNINCAKISTFTVVGHVTLLYVYVVAVYVTFRESMWELQGLHYVKL